MRNTTLVSKLLVRVNNMKSIPPSLVEKLDTLPYKLRRKVEAYMRNPKKHAPQLKQLLSTQLKTVRGGMADGEFATGAFSVVVPVSTFNINPNYDCNPDLYKLIFNGICVHLKSLDGIMYNLLSGSNLLQFTTKTPVSFLRDDIGSKFLFRTTLHRSTDNTEHLAKTTKIIYKLLECCKRDFSVFDNSFTYCTNQDSPLIESVAPSGEYIINYIKLTYIVTDAKNSTTPSAKNSTIPSYEQLRFDKTIYVQVLKHMSGDLYNYINVVAPEWNRYKITYVETQFSYLASSLEESVNRLHNGLVYHHDIKLANIVWDIKDDNYRFMLNDFDGILMDTEIHSLDSYCEKAEYTPMFQSPAIPYIGGVRRYLDFLFVPWESTLYEKEYRESSMLVRDAILITFAKDRESMLNYSGKELTPADVENIRKIYRENDNYSIGITLLLVLLFTLREADILNALINSTSTNVANSFNQTLNHLILKGAHYDTSKHYVAYGRYVLYCTSNKSYYIDFLLYVTDVCWNHRGITKAKAESGDRYGDIRTYLEHMMNSLGFEDKYVMSS